MNITTLSKEVFNQKSKEAVNAQSLRKEVNLVNVEFINETTLKVEDKNIPISKRAYHDFIESLQIPKAFLNRFSTSFGAETETAFINRLKNSFAAKSKTCIITLVVNPKEKVVTNILGESKSLISNESFLGFVTQMVDQYKLDVVNFHLGENGECSVDTISPNSFFYIPGMKDENFYAGTTFTNAPRTGLTVNPYIHRLSCANGISTKSYEETYKLDSLEPDSIFKFNQNMQELAAVNFVPKNFVNRVTKASMTQCSYKELLDTSSKVLTESKIDFYALQQYVPTQRMENAFNNFGIDTLKLTNHQKQNLKTNVSMWSLINAVTNLASNDIKGVEIGEYNRKSLMVYAGTLLTKTFDCENLIVGPYDNFKVEEQETVNTGN